jgi:hypothetical protein
MLREIKGLGQIKTKCVLQIYNSLIGSVLQYASCELSFSSSITPNNFGFLLYSRILLFNFKIVCPGCCFNLENMLYSVLSALMLILHFLH